MATLLPAADGGGGESKLAPPADVELGPLPSSASGLSLSGSTTANNTTAGAGGHKEEGPALRWNIERLAVPVRKRRGAGKGGAQHLSGLAGGGFDAHAMLDGGFGGSGDGGGGSKAGERNILHKVVGQAERGQMLALMGASGALLGGLWVSAGLGGSSFKIIHRRCARHPPLIYIYIIYIYKI